MVEGRVKGKLNEKGERCGAGDEDEGEVEDEPSSMIATLGPFLIFALFWCRCWLLTQSVGLLLLN